MADNNIFESEEYKRAYEDFGKILGGRQSDAESVSVGDWAKDIGRGVVEGVGGIAQLGELGVRRLAGDEGYVPNRGADVADAIGLTPSEQYQKMKAEGMPFEESSELLSPETWKLKDGDVSKAGLAANVVSSLAPMLVGGIAGRAATGISRAAGVGARRSQAIGLGTGQAAVGAQTMAGQGSEQASEIRRQFETPEGRQAVIDSTAFKEAKGMGMDDSAALDFAMGRAQSGATVASAPAAFAESLIFRGLSKQAKAFGDMDRAARPGTITGALKVGATTALSEGAQEAAESYSGQLGARMLGGAESIDVGRGTLSDFALGAISGGAMSGAAQGVGRVADMAREAGERRAAVQAEADGERALMAEIERLRSLSSLEGEAPVSGARVVMEPSVGEQIQRPVEPEITPDPRVGRLPKEQRRIYDQLSNPRSLQELEDAIEVSEKLGYRQNPLFDQAMDAGVLEAKRGEVVSRIFDEVNKRVTREEVDRVSKLQSDYDARVSRMGEQSADERRMSRFENTQARKLAKSISETISMGGDPIAELMFAGESGLSNHPEVSKAIDKYVSKVGADMERQRVENENFVSNSAKKAGGIRKLLRTKSRLPAVERSEFIRSQVEMNAGKLTSDDAASLLDEASRLVDVSPSEVSVSGNITGAAGAVSGQEMEVGDAVQEREAAEVSLGERAGGGAEVVGEDAKGEKVAGKGAKEKGKKARVRTSLEDILGKRASAGGEVATPTGDAKDRVSRVRERALSSAKKMGSSFMFDRIFEVRDGVDVFGEDSTFVNAYFDRESGKIVLNSARMDGMTDFDFEMIMAHEIIHRHVNRIFGMFGQKNVLTAIRNDKKLSKALDKVRERLETDEFYGKQFQQMSDAEIMDELLAMSAGFTGGDILNEGMVRSFVVDVLNMIRDTIVRFLETLRRKTTDEATKAAIDEWISKISTPAGEAVLRKIARSAFRELSGEAEADASVERMARKTLGIPMGIEPIRSRVDIMDDSTFIPGEAYDGRVQESSIKKDDAERYMANASTAAFASRLPMPIGDMSSNISSLFKGSKYTVGRGARKLIDFFRTTEDRLAGIKIGDTNIGDMALRHLYAKRDAANEVLFRLSKQFRNSGLSVIDDIRQTRNVSMPDGSVAKITKEEMEAPVVFDVLNRMDANGRNVISTEDEMRSMGLSETQMAFVRMARQSVAKALIEAHEADVERQVNALAGVSKEEKDSAITTLRTMLNASPREGDFKPSDYSEVLAGMIERRGDEGFEADARAARSSGSEVQSLIDSGYIPQSRFGRHAFTVKGVDQNGDETVAAHFQFESEADARRAEREYADTGKVTVYAPAYQGGKPIRTYDVAEESKAMGVQSVEKTGQYAEMADVFNKGSSHVTAKDIQDLASRGGLKVNDGSGIGMVYARLIEELMGRSGTMARHLNRKGVVGASPDIIRGISSFSMGVAKQAADSKTEAERSELLSTMRGLRGRDEKGVIDFISDTLDYEDREESSFVGTAKSFQFTMRLGFSIASALSNLTSAMLLVMPYIISRTGSFNGSRALSLAFRLMFSKNLNQEIEAISDPELRAFLSTMVSKGRLDDGVVGEFSGGVSKARGGNDKLNALSTMSGFMFQRAEVFNRAFSLIAAYDAHHNAKADKRAELGELEDFANEVVTRTQGDYTKINRSEAMRAFGGLGSVVLQFKMFPIQYAQTYFRLMRAASRGDRNAAMGFAVMTLVMMAFSGGGGIPFMEDTKNVIDSVGQQLGYGTNSKKWMRENLSAALGDDAARVLMSGLGDFVGVDLQRIGTGNIIPGIAAFKKSEKDAYKKLWDVLGPTASQISAIAEARKNGVEGVMSAALPGALSNLYRGFNVASTGRYVDSRGNTVDTFENNPVAAGLVKMAGFIPASVGEMRWREGFVRDEVAIRDAFKTEYENAYKKAVMDGDMRKASDMRKAVADFNERSRKSGGFQINSNFPRLSVEARKSMGKTEEKRLVDNMSARDKAIANRILKGE